ncbi:MAG: FHA domain-containing protein [Prevotellaceae bacterium]|nr:FHA domain-containing protein [Prevotellaceae bacterium]
MQRLRGKTILIGREAEQSRLCVVLLSGGQRKMALVGAPASVPASVSHYNPADQSAHCKIEVDQSGTMQLTNLKSQNVTYVDGMEVESKRISDTSSVTLGSGKYVLDLDLVLHTAIKMVDGMAAQPAKPSQQLYSIAHLEKVWNDYDDALETIQRRQQQMAKRRLLPIIIGSASSLLSAVCALVSTSALYVTIPIAAISFVIYIFLYFQKDTSIADRKAAVDAFTENYVCPNDSCRHFMGNQPYKVLRQNKKCPYCGCLFTDKQA